MADGRQRLASRFASGSLACLMMVATSSTANPIYRCTGSDGSITFSQISGPNCEQDEVKTYTPPPEEVARQKETLRQWRTNRNEAAKNAERKSPATTPVPPREPDEQNTGNALPTAPLILTPPIQYMTPIETDD